MRHFAAAVAIMSVALVVAFIVLYPLLSPLFASGSGATPVRVTDFIQYVHDDARGVGCWVSNGGGISCLPDKGVAP